jgi:hypothetical protein
MEVAICTRCQSNNPSFTKFCLVCGLEITNQMKRTISVTASKATTLLVKEESLTESSSEAQSNEPTTTPKESSRWLKGLRRFGLS